MKKKKIKKSDKFDGGYWSDYWEGFEHLTFIHFTKTLKSLKFEDTVIKGVKGFRYDR